jgi:hypothetical protein
VSRPLYSSSGLRDRLPQRSTVERRIVNRTKKPLGLDRLPLMADTMGPLCVRCLGWLAKLGLAFVLPALALVIFELLQPLGGHAFAQEAMSNLAPEDDAPPDMSREQWRERVAEAKRRARQFALERRGRPTFENPSIADEERMASERVLNDDSLQRGDIVSTNKGLFVYKGQSDQERRESDFVALPPH